MTIASVSVVRCTELAAHLALSLLVITACAAGPPDSSEDCQYWIGVSDQAGNQACGARCTSYELECFRDAGGPAECECVVGPKNGSKFQMAHCSVEDAAAAHCK